MKIKKIFAALCIVSALCSLEAAALAAPTQQKPATKKVATTLSANDIKYNVNTGDARATGNVVIKREGSTLWGDEAEGNTNDEIMTLRGNVRGEFPAQDATLKSESATWTGDKSKRTDGLVEAFGSVRLTRGAEDYLNADYVRWEPGTENYSARGSVDGLMEKKILKADEARRSGCEGHVVLVDANGQAFRGHAVGELDGVPRTTEGAVADNLPRLGVELGQDLGEHHGYVPIFCCQDPHPLVVVEKRVELVLEALLRRVPLVGVPHLEVVPGAHDRDVSGETELLAGAGLVGIKLAEGNAARGVDVHLDGTAQKPGPELNVLAAAGIVVVVSVLKESFDEPLEPLRGEAVHALLHREEVDRLSVPVNQLLAEDGRQGNTSLGIHGHRIRPGEHVTLPSRDEKPAPERSVR